MPGWWMWRVGLRVRRLDHLVDVDPGRGRVAGELVREADVHVAVGGLGQLGELGRLGAARDPRRRSARGRSGALVEVEHLPRRTRRPSRRPRSDESADELRVLAEVGEHPAGEHALRREDEVEVDALGEARRSPRAAASTACASCRPGAWSRRRPACRASAPRRATWSPHPSSRSRARRSSRRRTAARRARRRRLRARRRRSRWWRAAGRPATSSESCSCRCASPGNGSIPWLTRSTVRWETSTPTTSWPLLANWTASGRPILPRAMTAIFKRVSSRVERVQS